ncbi:hypothetical protein RIR_jg40022.t1 [Rhizophagus irregularis DAOM 181602=DAOM 197198]|nr:hypothetical protein RIR_jg40022.t1 [Rhizophagus irregularis DAOM 181602=DAOM 197198]
MDHMEKIFCIQVNYYIGCYISTSIIVLHAPNIMSVISQSAGYIEARCEHALLFEYYSSHMICNMAGRFSNSVVHDTYDKKMSDNQNHSA